jgi:tryptophan-rich sensory protein
VRIKLSSIVIIAVVVAVSVAGNVFTSSGMEWYRTLQLPAFTPPGGVIGIVWTLIYIMVAIAAILIWQVRDSSAAFKWLIALLVFNAILNALWSWVFFGIHQLGLAVAEMTLLNLTNLLIIILSWNRQRIASLLFIPYFAWVCFATYLAVAIWRLNT